MINIVNNRGVQIQFGNGYMVSIMNGRGNYCSVVESNQFEQVSSDCEVAIFYVEEDEREFVTRAFDPSLYDDVMPHISADQLPTIVAWAASQPKGMPSIPDFDY